MSGTQQPEAPDGAPSRSVPRYSEPPALDQPAKIGRYELVYELGSGGMANVYLARTKGPAGFRKWFAIKRIHPHLAKDTRFVEMFLDEARIAASLQHPNVAQVFDLGEDQGEYFIAMEYLHGEHLGEVVARALAQWNELPVTLSAAITAAAAEGLHHAHQLHDERGNPLGLVHRDVSPHNIFITYDGQVKVTDFGVAKAANRLTHTQTGDIKGKMPYLAPEQALGQPIDHRADIFSLGIVLWELTTGRRLFNAGNEMQTIMRITSGKVTRPTEVVPQYPRELESIVLRALALRPVDRYGTAEEMACNLEDFVAVQATRASPRELRSMMHELFADRIREKRQIFSARTDQTLSQPLVNEQNRSRVLSRPPLTQTLKLQRSRLGVWALPLVSLLAAALAVTWMAASSSSDTSAIRIDTQPAGATILLDGSKRPHETPVLVEGIEHGAHEIRVEKDGYEPFETEFLAEGDRVNLMYQLTPTTRADAHAGTQNVPHRSGTEDGQGATTFADTSPQGSADEQRAAQRRRTAALRRKRARARQRAAREPAKLNLLTRPWAKVWIDGQHVGQTPLMGHEISPGPLAVQLQPQGQGPKRTLRLQADPGETISKSLDLR